MAMSFSFDFAEKKDLTNAAVVAYLTLTRPVAVEDVGIMMLRYEGLRSGWWRAGKVL
jgi:hypothetical protein